MSSLIDHRPLTTRLFETSHALVGTGLILVLVSGLSGCCAWGKRACDQQIAQGRELTYDALNALHRGHVDRAETLLSEATEVCPNDQRIREHLAHTLVQKGDLDRAIVHMTQAVNSSGGDPRLHVELGRLYLTSRQPHIAYQHALKALQGNRQLAPAWALKGRAELENGQFETALASLHRSLGYDDQQTDVSMDIARTYQKLGRPGRALATIELLSKNFPPGQEPQHLVLLKGTTLVDLKQFGRAVECLAQGASRSDADAELLVQLSRAQHLAGELSNARLTARTAKDRFPDNQAVRQWVASLEKAVADDLTAATR